MISRILVAMGAVLALGLAAAAPAQANGGYERERQVRGCPGCNLKPSRVVRTSSKRQHVRVVHHTRVVPSTRVVNHNRLVLHRHTVNHRHLTVHRHRIIHRVTVVNRYNTFHRRAVNHRHHYASRHQYRHERQVRHVHQRGRDVWCNCGGPTYASGW